MWLLPALLLATAIVLSIPLSAYFAWLMDGKYRAPRPLRCVREPARHRSAGLEAVRARARDIQCRAVRVRLRRPVAATAGAAESARPRHAGANDDLQHRHIFHDEYESAALFRRSESLQFQPDILHPAEHVPVRVDRVLRPFGDHSRVSRRGDGRQFLRRYVARRDVHLSAGRADFRRPLHSTGHADDLCQRRGRDDARTRLNGHPTTRARPSRRPSSSARSRRPFRSRCSAPTAAASTA